VTNARRRLDGALHRAATYRGLGTGLGVAVGVGLGGGGETKLLASGLGALLAMGVGLDEGVLFAAS
jgi:hypothetical protein